MITIFMRNDRLNVQRINDYFLADRYIIIDPNVSKTVIDFYLNEILRRCIAKGEEIQLLVHNREQHRIIKLSEVYYVSSNLRKIQIIGMEKKSGNRISVECYNKLSDIEEPLNCFGFCRVSGSFIVAMNYIRKVEKMTVEMINGDILSIGRQYYRKLISRLESYERLIKV